MNQHEEELQKNIEEGNPFPADNADAKAYQHVFDALKKAPATSLPSDFAVKVTARLVEREQKRSLSRDLFWLVLGLFLIVISVVVAIVFSGFKPDMGFLKGLTAFKGLLIFAALFIAGLHWIDRKLIQKKNSVI